jgi:hypothetical protein
MAGGAAIFIRGGRPVVDEYLDILFEVLNMSGDKRFKELYQQAKMGSISRTNFVTEMLREEFQTVKTLKHIVPTLGLSPDEIANSKAYKDLFNTPDEFEKFTSYIQRYSPGGIQQKYERYYDNFRGNAKAGYIE